MTHAHLPARNVVEACRLAKGRIGEQRQFEHDLVELRAENIARGRVPPERATEPDPFKAAIEKNLREDEFRVEGLMTLAQAAGDGTIAVDTDDFRLIAKHFRA